MAMKEKFDSQVGFKRIIANLRWLNGGARPFKRGNIIEIPLYAPLDCDLLGYPNLENRTPNIWVKYAVDCLVGGLNRNGKYYILNFHDWIIGSNNRIKILDEILRQISQNKQVMFISANLIK